MDPWVGIGSPDAVYCLGRVVIIGIVLTSELAVAGRKRSGYERDLLLALGFGILLVSELLLGVASLVPRRSLHVGWWRLWLLYPALNADGILALTLASEYCRFGREPAKLRLRGRIMLAAAGLLLALGVGLAVLTEPGERLYDTPPTSFANLGVWSLALHGLQALAVVWLMLSARRHDPGLLTLRQSQAFVCGCAAYAAGALSQAAFGPREHLTTLALGVFAALLLRYLYIEYGLLGIRAVEKSSYRMLMFHRTTTQIKSTLDEREVCEILLDGLQTNLGAESAAVFLCDEKREFLRARLVLGPFPPPLPLETKPQGERELRQAIQAMRVPVGEGVVGGVAATGRPAYFYDADQPSPDRPAQPFHTAIVLPLHKLNQVFGVVAVVNRRNGGSFTEDDVRFMGLVLEHASLALANARLQEQMLRSERTFEQLRVAREIQLRLIPSALPDAPGLQSHAMYRPANEVGGDYYDLYRLDDHRVGIVVADVSGKGVPAAIIMAIASTALKTLAPAEGSPCQCLMRLNATLRGEVRRGMFVTVAYAVIDLRTRAMRLACAGHEPVLLCSPSAGASAFLRPKGPALGLLPPERFELAIAEETRTLEPGDALFFYTDGVTEALEPAQPEAGKQRLRDLAIQHGGETPQAMVERVRRAIEERAGPATQGDDITIVALQVVGPPATPTPASPAGAESAAAAGSPAPASGP